LTGRLSSEGGSGDQMPGGSGGGPNGGAAAWAGKGEPLTLARETRGPTHPSAAAKGNGAARARPPARRVCVAARANAVCAAFEDVPVLSGDTRGDVGAISGDGQVVVGTSQLAARNRRIGSFGVARMDRFGITLLTAVTTSSGSRRVGARCFSVSPARGLVDFAEARPPASGELVGGDAQEGRDVGVAGDLAQFGAGASNRLDEVARAGSDRRQASTSAVIILVRTGAQDELARRRR
jgi:hypothetical protein